MTSTRIGPIAALGGALLLAGCAAVPGGGTDVSGPTVDCSTECFAPDVTAAALDLTIEEMDLLRITPTYEFGEIDPYFVADASAAASATWHEVGAAPDACLVSWPIDPVLVGTADDDAPREELVYFAGEWSENPGESLDIAFRQFPDAEMALAHLAEVERRLGKCTSYSWTQPAIGTQEAIVWNPSISPMSRGRVPDNIRQVGWIENYPWGAYRFIVDIARDDTVVRVTYNTNSTFEKEDDFREVIEGIVSRLGDLEPSTGTATPAATPSPR